jgi:hypothetical protein
MVGLYLPFIFFLSWSVSIIVLRNEMSVIIGKDYLALHAHKLKVLKQKHMPDP